MRVLRNDSFARRSGGNHRRRSRGVAIFSLMLLSVALLVLSRIDNSVVHNARRTLVDLAAPALATVTQSLAPVRSLRERLAAMAVTREEMDRLKAANQQLAGWEARARELERRLADLSGLARVVAEAPIEFATVRVIADAGGPFARSVLVNGGSETGLRAGYPVISADGLVGRVLETGPRAARLLLLTDLNSRVPVLIGEQHVRGILAGDNTPSPRLVHLPAHVQVAAGEAVVTSGVGGLFPRGLRIGIVAATDAGPRVALHARLDEIEHVSVLFHFSPALDLIREEAPRPQAGAAPRRALAGQPAGAEPAPPK
jgi:rod shape-determining protein MreC